MTDVAIVGAGIIGLLTAKFLAAQNYNVVIVDQNRVAMEASAAGGGIISPLYPWRYGCKVSELAAWSQRYYPLLAEELYYATDIDSGLYQSGLLILDCKEELPAQLWAESFQQTVEVVSAADVYQLQPGLGDFFNAALWIPQVYNINNPKLLQALHKFLLTQRNVTFIENVKVNDFIVDNDKITAAVADDCIISADKFLISAGAWSGKLLQSLGIKLEIEPIKGQMLSFSSESEILDSIVLYRNNYLVPRSPTEIVVGSTLEHSNFDKSTTAEAFYNLQRAAMHIMPQLQQCKITRHWAGLRPGNFYDAPFMGQVPQLDNLFVAAGHYRNGLVLAPASAKFISDLIMQKESLFPIEWYQLPQVSSQSCQSIAAYI